MSDSLRTTRKVRQGPVEVDYEDCALVVNFDVEVVKVDENGRVHEVMSRESDVRRVKVKFQSDKNMAQLALDVVQKCKYIHPSRTEEIEQLLLKLKKQAQANAETATKESIKQQNSQPTKQPQPSSQYQQQPQRDGSRQRTQAESQSSSKSRASNSDYYNSVPANEQQARQEEDRYPPARMDELDDYLEMLYEVSGKSEKEKEEGLNAQIKGTAMIMKLCRDVMNLEQLIQNGTVMGALTRVFQDEHKKSLELTFNLLRIFLAFSNFLEMHGLMANYRIGVLTMKAIEFETKRSEHREVEKKEAEKKYELDLAAAKSSTSAGNGIGGAAATDSTQQAAIDKLRKAREKEIKRAANMQKKQDKLLFVSFYVLLNLAEDVNVERKMIKKGLIDFLFAMLNRTSGDLLIICVTFLKKLVIFEENKEDFKSKQLVSKLSKFVLCSSQPLVNISLRLLFNLSFDQELREQMVRGGLLPKLVSLLKTPSFRARTLKLLYHLSIDDRCKSMFTYTDGIPVLLGMVINFPQSLLAKELAALMINLSLNPRNAELLVANRCLSHFMDRLVTSKDPLLAKIVRNISLWTFNSQQDLENVEVQYRHRGLWSPHLKALMQLATSVDNQDVLIEVFGTLGNLTIYDLPAHYSWAKLFRDFHMVSLLSKLLVPGMSQNDMLLEVVLVIAAAAAEPQACELLASSTIIQQLYQLWKEKGDDVEILLQCIHCFHRFFVQPASREEAMYGTRAVVDMMECLSHRNNAVRTMADIATELVLELDRKDDGELGTLGVQIRKKRFESYNYTYLQSLQLEENESSLSGTVYRDLHDSQESDDGGGDMSHWEQKGEMKSGYNNSRNNRNNDYVDSPEWRSNIQRTYTTHPHDARMMSPDAAAHGMQYMAGDDMDGRESQSGEGDESWEER